MESCLYEGRVRHRRHRPAAHAFAMPLFLVYLDLAELDRVFAGRWLWSTRLPAFARFRRADHLGDPALPLDAAVRDLVEARTARRPRGPIRLLTHLRYAGFAMNPVSFYYCFDEAGVELSAIAADVTSTPWRERHVYVLPVDGAGKIEAPKQLHVSPFHPMDLSYRFRFTRPGESLAVRIEARDGEAEPLFDASLALRRVPISTASLARALVRHPLLTARVAANIYWQALRLHGKGVPYHPHPRRIAPREAAIGEQP